MFPRVRKSLILEGAVNSYNLMFFLRSNPKCIVSNHTVMVHIVRDLKLPKLSPFHPRNSEVPCFGELAIGTRSETENEINGPGVAFISHKAPDSIMLSIK